MLLAVDTRFIGSLLEVHVPTVEVLGRMPTSTNGDTSKLAVSKIVGNREREVTKELMRLKITSVWQGVLTRKAMWNDWTILRDVRSWCRSHKSAAWNNSTHNFGDMQR